jgi:hypothetical protein
MEIGNEAYVALGIAIFAAGSLIVGMIGTLISALRG